MGRAIRQTWLEQRRRSSECRVAAGSLFQATNNITVLARECATDAPRPRYAHQRINDNGAYLRDEIAGRSCHTREGSAAGGWANGQIAMAMSRRIQHQHSSQWQPCGYRSNSSLTTDARGFVFAAFVPAPAPPAPADRPGR